MADTQQFTGKAAIVTGAGQGIGEGYAKGLASRGCAVVVADINETQGRRVADEIGKAGGKALFAKVDVASERSEEHTSELQSLMRNSYAVFCLKQKKHHAHHATLS